MSKPTNPPQHTCPQQTQGRQDGPLVPPPGPKVEAQKEFLKAVLARGIISLTKPNKGRRAKCS